MFPWEFLLALDDDDDDAYLEQYPAPEQLPEDAAHWPDVDAVGVMLGAQENLRGSVVLSDHLLGHVSVPVTLLHSEAKQYEYLLMMFLMLGVYDDLESNKVGVESCVRTRPWHAEWDSGKSVYKLPTQRRVKKRVVECITLLPSHLRWLSLPTNPGHQGNDSFWFWTNA